MQELNSANPPVATANLLTGLKIDEGFARADSNGAMNFLADALGSTIALANSAGAIATQYTYYPFGNVTASGQANANPYQFTGRENDGTGLHFYRARYYSPSFQRFIAQDLLDSASGVNLYGYVLDSPVNFRDSLGFCGEPNAQPVPVPSPPGPSPTPQGPQSPEISSQAPQQPAPPCAITPAQYDQFYRGLGAATTVGSVVGGVLVGPESGGVAVVSGVFAGAIAADFIYFKIFWAINCP